MVIKFDCNPITTNKHLWDEDGVDVASSDGAVVSGVGGGARGSVVGGVVKWVLEACDDISVFDCVVALVGWGIGAVDRGGNDVA